jgi:hypothetical protein
MVVYVEGGGGSDFNSVVEVFVEIDQVAIYFSLMIDHLLFFTLSARKCGRWQRCSPASFERIGRGTGIELSNNIFMAVEERKNSRTEEVSGVEWDSYACKSHNNMKRRT